MPAISQIVWLMMLLATPGPVPGSAPQRAPMAVWGPALVAAGLFLGCFFSTTRPVLASRLQIDLGNLATNPEARVRHYREATVADPLAPEPWQQLAMAEFQMWVALGADDDRRFEQAVADQRQGIARDPESFSGYRTLGMFYWQRFQKTHAAEDAEQATMDFGAAVSRYPNRSSLQAEWAEALAGAGHPDRAKQAALRALDLDIVNHFAGHSDKYLPEAVVNQMEALARK
jgi:tetratricopeptide (TPR) repeat protein